MLGEDSNVQSSPTEHSTVRRQSVKPVAIHTLLCALCIFVGAVGVIGCGSGEDGPEQQQPGPTDTIEVTQSPEIDISNDIQAAPVKPKLTGILPGDFPADIPLYLPSSLIDFKGGAHGARSVTLLTPHDMPRVRQRLRELLRAKGWNVTSEAGSGASTIHQLTLGERRLRLRVENARPGTSYVFEY